MEEQKQKGQPEGWPFAFLVCGSEIKFESHTNIPQ